MHTQAELEARLVFPLTEPPAPATLREVAPGVNWLRMPLPMSLDHINLYLLEDGDGWLLVDTGLRGDTVRRHWDETIERCLEGRPITRILCTHMHPDHTGQAGNLSQRFRAPLLMSHAEYHMARSISRHDDDGPTWQAERHLVRAGLDADFQQRLRAAYDTGEVRKDLALPAAFQRLRDGDRLAVNGRDWRIITGNGHSPEHVCLHSPDLRLFISGDQVLPIITSNVSVFPTEPEAEPLSGWLASLARIREHVDDDVLVLPAHNLPFYRLHERLQQIIDHHEDRMLALEEACAAKPRSAVELLPVLFKRKLEGHAMFMAVGECIAHLHLLMRRQRIERRLDGDAYRYHAIADDLARRARPGDHDDRDDEPSV